MPRFYIPPGELNPDSPVLTGPEAHHALHVLRLKPGDKLTILNGQGGVLDTTILSTTKKEALLAPAPLQTLPPPRAQIHLASAISKGKTFDSVIQKATELGASAIFPLITQRTIVKPSPSHLTKYSAITIEAAKQCGIPYLPIINKISKISEVIELRKDYDLLLVGALWEGSLRIQGLVKEFQGKHGRPPKKILVFVGPEGDFTDTEKEMFQKAGVHSVSFGPNVLRAETAAFYALSVLNSLLL